ncbi:16S rRNA (cytosine(967)-C(5))-methyltransferase RsmB [Legionella longbeachae]|uniref:16S rRNA (cytosine(967)-C(5))-methyltransferase n=1 Tax=Legionella longbeachae serogroup 1 (strain NSW150) TaxID=661367 RepID=D3HQ00_LEGLN|nr:16S rRNA (cytosine(967)-C(5))-methyltransferase RsmB [Legionella longbeachae]VEE01484.1 16S rRNA m5C967 methyltransferase, S-adenosyl-L -methionine-dependent [Legionella oakridgensis]ARB92158.1 16S rRNA (cytosine(967)-C(5))-methyltransferase RsmB [Legionella longbeachae]ARM34662.1 16S rRNA (cytosine(967)-C(5))-methyltransferase RsmB [Legionella longbeachae]EEZ96034.1 ribosomal RNA small subunit methyltransferase B [Legionella longbeachae D-4968]QIN31419.1 16S rRNA (cytosine(967)-C(5))-methy
MNNNKPPSKFITEKKVRRDSKQCTTTSEPRKKPNERLHALYILTHLLVEKTPLSQLMASSAEVSPMTKEICFGFCRHYFRLQAIANCLIHKKPKEIELWVALLIGIYQLHYMKLPDYAVVKETVALLEKIKKGWAKGLVNAVLRNFCRQHDEILTRLNKDPLFLYGHPQWLLRRLQKDWPNNWQAITKANEAHPPMTLRVNLRKISVMEYLNVLKQANITATPHSIAAEAIVLETPCDVHQLPGFAQGLVSVQDGAAQLATSLLSLKPGLRVLDACCAPGGKTCHILEKEPHLAECVAVDIDSKRLDRVRENLNRLHLHATLLQGDASNPSQWWDGKLFDRILLDAPCSATGVIRRHSDIKLLRNDEEIATITKIQHTMLSSLWPLLTKGGLLVYATCSVMLAENEQQIANFIKNNPDCNLITKSWPWGHTTKYGQQILPGEQCMDGFFYAVLFKDEK